MYQPRVSIVIPIYNVEKYLGRCIESAIGQSYTETEIILVDDGSTDSSPLICEEWAKKDSRIKVIHKSNAGAGLARNTGLDAATGEYVLFVDSDDYIHPETVKSCVSAAVRDKSEIVLYGRADVCRNGNIKEKKILTDKYLYRDSEATEELLSSLCTHSKGFGFGVVAKMFDMKALRKSGVRFFSEREVCSEDAVFITEFFSSVTSATVIPEYYYMCVLHGDSLSNTVRGDCLQMNNAFLGKVTDICEAKGYSENVLNHLKARYQIYILAGMKNIAAEDSGLCKKIKALKAFYEDETLCGTLSDSVLDMGSSASRVFWKLFKAKCFLLCCLLLKLKTKK